MSAKSRSLYPSEQTILRGIGERLQLARKRRKLPMEAVASRANVSRATLYRAEAGDPAVTLGTYIAVLRVYGLEADLNLVAEKDELGRRIQDSRMSPSRVTRPSRRKTEVATGAPQDGEETAAAPKRKPRP